MQTPALLIQLDPKHTARAYIYLSFVSHARTHFHRLPNFSDICSRVCVIQDAISAFTHVHRSIASVPAQFTPGCMHDRSACASSCSPPSHVHHRPLVCWWSASHDHDPLYPISNGQQRPLTIEQVQRHRMHRIPRYRDQLPAVGPVGCSCFGDMLRLRRVMQIRPIRAFQCVVGPDCDELDLRLRHSAAHRVCLTSIRLATRLAQAVHANQRSAQSAW